MGSELAQSLDFTVCAISCSVAAVYGEENQEDLTLVTTRYVTSLRVGSKGWKLPSYLPEETPPLSRPRLLSVLTQSVYLSGGRPPLQ